MMPASCLGTSAGSPPMACSGEARCPPQTTGPGLFLDRSSSPRSPRQHVVVQTLLQTFQGRQWASKIALSRSISDSGLSLTLRSRLTGPPMVNGAANAPNVPPQLAPHRPPHPPQPYGDPSVPTASSAVDDVVDATLEELQGQP
ncbi:uncharacterized protein CIMG_12700 [Coccidioides immitis RS]|uniref:Uncharacterized protein n=1 Tax=Coccidioides immitis (strain RS) TaxID=246410 RepID=A0A0D8JUT4_COCIM|nr:uncharacterized protein CIMG_12700 [Coccidioides immitis RS]KJF60038.1 hypothetical protein CIMG_12700 [Coccidioides immitis RS]